MRASSSSSGIRHRESTPSLPPLPRSSQARLGPALEQYPGSAKTHIRMEFMKGMADHDPYRLKFLDEVAKLRWLIQRQPAAVELRYYLLFMLIAHKRYPQASEECRRILAGHPQDILAQLWLAKLKGRGYEELSTPNDEQFGLIQ